MIRQMGALAAITASLCLAGCGSMPKDRVEQGAAVTGLYFAAPPAAWAFVDGAAAVPVTAHSSINTWLPVSSGLHHVTIKSGDAVLLSQDIYVGSGSRVLVRAQ